MKQIIIATIFLISSFFSFSQNAVSLLIEKKVVIPTSTLKQIGAKTSSLQQFTNDNREDLELYSAINPTNSDNIITSWMSIDPSGSATNPLLFKMMYTLDGGISWQNSDIDFMPHNLSQTRRIGGGGDPVIAFDNNGLAHFSWLYLVANVVSMDEIYMDLVLYYAYSADSGATWVRPITDTIAWGVFDYELGVGITAVDSGYPPDKQWMAVNPLNNDLLISTTEFYHADSITNIWGIRRKPADSLDFITDHKLVPPSNLFASTQGAICFDKNGLLHAIYPAYKDTLNILVDDDQVATEYLFYQNSSDNGLTWSDTTVISEVYVNNMGSALQNNNTNTKAYNRLFASSYIAVDTSGGDFDGRIYAIWNSNDTNFFSNVNVYLSYSDDNGQTWSNPIKVNTDEPADYKFHHRPSITVTPDGKVVASWYDTRNGSIPDVYNTDYFVGISYDGGETFLQRNVNDTLFNFNDIEHAFYVGEYYQLSASNDFINVFWSELNDEGSDLEIYYAKLLTDSVLSVDSNVYTTFLHEIRPLTSEINVIIYPNPVQNMLNINVNAENNGDLNFEIYTINGQLLKTINQNYLKGENNFQIDVSQFNPAQYILVSRTKYGRFHKIFIKN